MIVPKPPVKLEGHCSVLYDNTLYTYSANGFTSISLDRNATWTELPMGEPVSNAACVTGGLDGNEDQQALYVIGGTPSKGESSGLQRYSFKDKKWKTFDSVSGNMANRTSHKAVYLKSSSKLVIYGGHQRAQTDASSDTFAINTLEPYNLSAYSADKASPAYDPVLLSWNGKEAALVGGLTTPDQVHLFDPIQGWHSSNLTIPKPLSDGVQCAMVNGTDGSKILEAFDMSASPNNVTSITLLKSGGTPAQSGNSSESSTKRGITLDDYPIYDDSLASTTTRKDYSLAQGDDGLVVISSGSGSDTLAIFNQTSNSWINATKLFYGDQTSQQILGSTTSTPTATATGSTQTTSSASSSSDDSSSSNVGTIIGATLGGIVGLAAILIVILFILKHKKDAKKRAGQGQDGDKDRLSFQDRGVEPLTQSAYPMAKSSAPLAACSVDSLAIFSGKVGEEKSPRSAGAPPTWESKPSPLSTIQSSRELTPGEIDKAFEAQGAFPGNHPGDRSTVEGWGRYFQDKNAGELMAPPAAVAARPDSTATTATAWPMKTLTPINTSFLEAPKPLGCVVSGSPTTEHATSPKNGQYITIPESQSARISTASEITIESVDDYEPHDGSREQQSWVGRPPSSTYSRSYYNPSFYNPSGPDVPSLVAPLRDTRMNTRGSSVLIPDTTEPVPPRDPRSNNNNVNSDMSWLNLHADR
ncbi:hypothetical protein BDV29DRAFT_59140 [Aspergillus leporis]|uniref:Pre-mRNA splicing factor CLF1 n=1 Tax=Aspergillus leporis TaxID=41062 RepID=A0A5N5XBE7_9EURO|nr:hypothetical protein BDV29DRAFT_59140 [Aspergillus leporis]